jgi:hypothetical protein
MNILYLSLPYTSGQLYARIFLILQELQFSDKIYDYEAYTVIKIEKFPSTTIIAQFKNLYT